MSLLNSVQRKTVCNHRHSQVTAMIIICVGIWSLATCRPLLQLATVMRVLIFSAFSVVAIVLGLVFFFMSLSKHGPGLELVLSLPVLAFGTQRDLVQSWNAGFQACFHSIQACCRMLISLQWQSGRHGHGPRPCSNSSQESMISVNVEL
ncbi:hypothetical protein BT96DRAFT_491500 [Gymnopus androsaceus JB14]|uniref:Uncharacterized protein n=1 Tax=Gymnopus androsaceus JB14 TaxID=1447944 RepID=A0A6A4GPV0_9AGAR|nr:hypothetical protein BT96DRAFT_491500 [Gymnopus androsaceus JB14]